MRYRATKTTILLTTVSLLGPARWAMADLLGRYDFTAQSGVAPESDPTARFVLQPPTDTPPSGFFGLGTDVYGHDGDQGFVDFTSSSDTGFDDFALSATNGVLENATIWSLLPSGGDGTAPIAETDLFGTALDLSGYDLHRVRLTIHSLDMESWVPSP